MAIELFLASVRLYAGGASSWPPSALCRRGIILASVGFMPSGPRFAATGAVLRGCFFLPPQGGRREERARAGTHDRRRSKTITKVEELTQRKSAQPTETFGASCCSRVGRCCFSTANWKGTTGYTLFLSNAFLVYAVPPSAATMPHTLPGRLVRPEAQFHQLAGICFRFRTRRQGS